jgi:hypothetical protein
MSAVTVSPVAFEYTTMLIAVPTPGPFVLVSVPPMIVAAISVVTIVPASTEPVLPVEPGSGGTVAISCVDAADVGVGVGTTAGAVVAAPPPHAAIDRSSDDSSLAAASRGRLVTVRVPPQDSQSLKRDMLSPHFRVPFVER